MTKLKFGRHSQCIKAQKQAHKREIRNTAVKSYVKTVAKKVEHAVHQGNIDKARALFLEAMKILDRAGTKHIIPKNQISRKKSRLARLINSSAKSK